MKVNKKPERRKFRQETVIHSFITRPLSLEICRIIWNTPITPNQITIFRAILNLLSLVLFSSGDLMLSIIGFMVFHVHELLDSVDGMYARLKNLTSKKGIFLENVLDNLLSTTSSFLGLSLVVGSLVNSTYFLAISFFIFIFIDLLNVSVTNSISKLLIKEKNCENISYIFIFENKKINFFNLAKTIYIWKNELLLICYLSDIYQMRGFLLTSAFYVILSLYIGFRFINKIYKTYADIK